jgi:sugar phosphate isomerase/epimerase
MDRLGIEFISVFGLPPVEFVHLAADLGCRHIGIALEPMAPNPHHYPAWSLRRDKALRRETVVALRERSVSISLGEGFLVRPGVDIAASAGDLEIMRELGVRRINTLSIESDLPRSYDQFATLVEMADAMGIETVLEFLPMVKISNLDSALAAIRHVGKPSFRLLIDAMHLVRGGGTAADLAALDPNLIGYFQLCDVPLAFDPARYGDEARSERMVPGTGELPLADIVAAIPADCIVGLEVPMLSAAVSGEGPRERLERCLRAARGYAAGPADNGRRA